MLAARRCTPQLHTLLRYSATRRTVNRLLSNDDGTSSSGTSVQDYLTAVGIRSELQQPLLKTIQPLLGDKNTNDVTVSDIENAMSLEDLLALSQSIENEQQTQQRPKTTPKTRRRPTKQVVFSIPHHHDGDVNNPPQETTLTWRYGQSILELAQDQDFLERLDNNTAIMEGSCGGQCSCSTCHVYLDSITFGAIPHPPTEEELDMLDLAFEPKEASSRLGCQVRLNDSLLQRLDDSNPDHVITITIPSGVNNEWEN